MRMGSITAPSSGTCGPRSRHSWECSPWNGSGEAVGLKVGYQQPATGKGRHRIWGVTIVSEKSTTELPNELPNLGASGAPYEGMYRNVVVSLNRPILRQFPGVGGVKIAVSQKCHGYDVLKSTTKLAGFFAVDLSDSSVLGLPFLKIVIPPQKKNTYVQ